MCHSLLPLTSFADAVSQLASGGSVSSPSQALAVLFVWGVAAHVLALSALKRRRLHDSEARRRAGVPAAA